MASQNNQSTLSDENIQFHIAEYNTLRTEIMTHIKDVRVMQRGSIIGIAVFYAWYLTSQENFVNYAAQIVILWLPIIILFFVAKLSIMKLNSVYEAGRYICIIEKTFANASIQGWETHLTKLRQTNATAVKADRVDKGFWLAIAVIVGLISLLETVRLFGLIAELTCQSRCTSDLEVARLLAFFKPA